MPPEQQPSPDPLQQKVIDIEEMDSKKRSGSRSSESTDTKRQRIVVDVAATVASKNTINIDDVEMMNGNHMIHDVVPSLMGDQLSSVVPSVASNQSAAILLSPGDQEPPCHRSFSYGRSTRRHRAFQTNLGYKPSGSLRLSAPVQGAPIWCLHQEQGPVGYLVQQECGDG